MKFEEAILWLRGIDVFSDGCPYREPIGGYVAARDFYKRNQIPCCKLSCDTLLGGIFLRNDGGIAIWRFADSGPDELVDDIPRSWKHHTRNNKWIRTQWYLDRGPWGITDWLKLNAKLQP